MPRLHQFRHVLGYSLIVIGLVFGASQYFYHTKRVERSELLAFKAMVDYESTTIQIRRFDGDESLTFGNPKEGVFEESIWPDKEWRPGTVVYLHIANIGKNPQDDKLIANIEIPGYLLPHNPSVDQVWEAAAGGTYYYIDRKFLTR